MKESQLWISNRNGNVFTISESERYISQLTKTNVKGVRVKRLSASDWCAWAVGHDHRVYIFVIACEVPIRVPETTYENQRWSPLNGFRSSNLLPTDRKAWSNEHGQGDLPKESIRLPSAHWEWEGDWFIDENLQGDICTDSGGWQYAVNFTGHWTAESCWNSCVRKRKWIRFCRFTATNTWARVSDEEVVEKTECFIDLSVGGQMLPNQPQGFLSVWAITNSGQVYVRTSVCRDSPEGQEWQHIQCPNNMGIINIACGPTGLVWAITWDGHAIVRTHVSRESVYGLGWEVVPYPEEATRLMQVSVGRNSVWALSRDGKVWFRQGVNGDKLFWDATAATGHSWVLMVGEMDHVAVSANDQVYALGQDDEDKEIWFRTGVGPSEPGGKTWQRVILQENPEVFNLSSPSCLLSRASQPSMESPDDTLNMSDCFGSANHPIVSDCYSNANQPIALLHVSESSPGDNSLLLPNASFATFDDSSLSFQESASFQEPQSARLRSLADRETTAASWPVFHERSKSWQMVETMLQPSVLCPQADIAVEATENSLKHGSGCARRTLRGSEPLLACSTMQTTGLQGWTVGGIAQTFSCGHLQRERDCEFGTEQGSLGTDTQLGSIMCCTEKKGEVLRTASLSIQNENNTVCVSQEIQFGAELNSQYPFVMDNKDHLVNNVQDLVLVQPEQTLEQTQDLTGTVSNIMSVSDSVALKSSLNNNSDLALTKVFDSLDSGASSDDIINFATDLMNSEDDDNKERVGKNNNRVISRSDCDQQAEPGLVSFQEMHEQEETSSGSKFRQPPASIPWISMGPSENFTGHASVFSSPETERESIPAMTLTLAQPRYAWGWIAAGAFIVEDVLSVPWLSASSYRGSEPSLQYLMPRVSKDVRDHIVQQLRARNRRELHAFSSYEHAVEKTTWVKKVNIKLRYQGRDYDCLLEMEQGVGAELDGTLTLQFKLKRKPKVIQMNLQEIRCLKTCDDHRLALYTSDPETSVHPLIFIMSTEEELTEWLGTLNVANVMLWRLNTPILAGSVCSLTVPGHVFVHAPDETRASPLEMVWGQHGGHMAAIETTPCGIIWAVSFDQTPWVYSGGYGNAITREMSEMASNLREQVDYRTIRVFENQKWYPLVGFCSRGVFYNNFAWTTPKGKFVKSREDIKLPSSQWQWVSDWMVDFTTPGGVNNEGWQYSSKFDRPYHPHAGLRDSVRRRQWSRKCKLVTHGPWLSVGPPELMDLSLQVDMPTSPTDPIILWAIGANGDVVCRSDITLSQPMGKSWIHIATKSDMPFRSVSVGGRYRVWAIAVDGSVWYRSGVTPSTPQGGALLSSISVGGSAVWAVDTTGNLWRREEITPTFPEGTRWTFVCNHVRRVSVGPKDQVWIVSEANFGRNKHSAGALYRRLGITETTPSGTSWELVIGPGWHYVSIRGLMTPNK